MAFGRPKAQPAGSQSRRTTRLQDRGRRPRSFRLQIESLEQRRVMAAYINELHFGPLFGDAAQDQYVELRGQPGGSFGGGTYLVVIGSAEGVHDLGDVHTIFDLSNQSLGANGLLVLMQSGAGYTVDSAARSLTGADGFVGIGGNIFSADASAKQIRGGSNTYLLIQSSNAPTLANDIDANDDGRPDGAYNNWTILDGATVFPWVENLWPQHAYAPIVFGERGVGEIMPGATFVVTDQLAYVGRIGQSTGFAADDWVAGNTVEFSDGSPTPTWKFQLQHGVFGTPRPYAFGGRFLDNVGADNWVGSVSGTVFLDLNSDGVQQAGENPITGVTLRADLQGDTEIGYFTETIEPNVYPLNSDVSNISSNVTLVSAGSDNVHQGFKIRPVQRFGSPNGELIFSHENVGFFNEDRRMRMDFYRPAKSISINIIGNSDSTPTYGRLEIFNAAGNSLGFVRSLALGAKQTQRLSISSPGNDIAWAVAYSENSYLASSPFGMLDELAFTLPEQSTVTDAQGKFTIQPMSRGDYSIRLQPQAGYDQVYPLGNAPRSALIENSLTLNGINFGVLGNLPPSLIDQNMHVSEAATAGGVIGVLPIVKGYPSQSLKVTVSGDPTGLFNIDPSTGNVVLARSELNFESQSAYTLLVKLEDVGDAALNVTATLQLTIDDANEPPIVVTQSKTIAENTTAQTLVASMTASDVDAGLAGQFTWSIAAGAADGAFVVDAATGEVRVGDASKINFESNRVFNLVMRATDAGPAPRFGEGMLVVTLSDVNEAPVLVAQSLGIAENSSPGILIGTLTAVHADANQTLQWEVLGGSGASLFQLGSADATVRLASGVTLDYESVLEYDLVVQVSDDGTPALVDTRTYTISVLNDNDAPKITDAEFDIVENSAAGTAIGAVSASDQDAGQKISFAISGDDAARFTIDPQSGQIQVAANAQLDFESHPSLFFTVTATDDGPIPKSSTATVSVRLSNVNEVPLLTTKNLNIAENSSAGLLAGTLQANDPEGAQGLQFDIIEQVPTWFTINSSSGELSVAAGAHIDFEGVKQCIMQVRVRDADGLTSHGTVTISATNVNDAPTLSQAPADTEASVGSQFNYAIPPGTFIDQDAGEPALRLFATNSTGFPLPAWLTFNAQSGVFSGLPSLGDVGAFQVRVTAVDSGNAVVSTSFMVEVRANPFPWSNPVMPLDVSNDGAVSARDALLVINFLNTLGATSISTGSAPSAGMLDTNRDNSVSAIDALLIINDLNVRPAGGEGERSVGQAEPESVQEPIWAWDLSQAIASKTDAAELNRKRRDEIIELLARARYAAEN